MKNTILENLREYDEKEFYNNSYYKYIERGAKYFRTGRVVDIKQSEDKEGLLFTVRGTEYYYVRLNLKDNNLTFTCTCPIWNSAIHCKHVICVLMAVKVLIKDDFDIVKLKNKHHYENLRERFLNIFNAIPETELAGESKKSAGVKVVIRFDNYGALKFTKAISPQSYNKNISENLSKTIDSNLPDDTKLTNILELSEKYSNDISVHISTKNNFIEVDYKKDLCFDLKLELNLVKEKINIKKIVLKDRIEIPDYVIFRNFIIDVQSSSMGKFKGKQAIALFNRLNTLNGNDMVSNTSVFNQHCLMIYKDVIEDNLIFKINGEIVYPEKVDLDYFVSVSKDFLTDDVHFTCETVIESDNSSFYNPFVAEIGNIKDFPRLNKSSSYQFKLLEGVYKLLLSKSKEETKQIIIDSVHGSGFRNNEAKNDARTFLKFISNSLLQNDMKQLLVKDNKWFISNVDMKKAAKIYAIPYLIFKEEMANNIVSTVVIPREIFLSKLSELKSKLEEQNIKLFFEKKLLKTKKLDINIDASVKTDIDWFEVKPEILCDGKLLSNEEWENILLNMGTVENEEGISLIDISSLSTLQIISQLLKKNKKSGKEETKITEIPKLQILDWVYLRNNGVKIRLSNEDEKIIDSLLNFKKIKSKDLPNKLNATLRDYQKDGYSWLSFLYEHRFGACLADDMGLGKTIQAIAFLAGIKERKIKSPEKYSNKPHLIILPPSLIFNWQSEIERFYPDLKTCEYSGANRKLNFKDVDIILTTYEIARRDIEKLKKEFFNVIIFDEAQNIKNIYAERTSSVRQLNGNFKLCLTGTPLENHIGEYYSIIDLAVPGLLEGYKEFMSLAREGDIHFAIKRTRPFVLRRTKNQILKELPEKIESDIYLEMTDIQKSFYVRMVNEIKQIVEEAYKDKPAQQAGIIALTAILRLRQICVSPKLVDKSFKDGSPKSDYLISKVKELIDEGHSCLLFSQFTGSLDIIEEELDKENISFVRMDGKTPMGKRKDVIENFQNGNVKIFLVSLKTGGVGLNLTRASYVFHVDPWWNPAVENQATDRTHRIGQKNTVFVNRLLMHNSIEEKMMKLKEIKKELYDKVMNFSGEGNISTNLTKRDFEFLLS